MSRRRIAASAVLLAAVAAGAAAQLVPVTRCNGALPCSIPYGLRPADAAAWTPGAQVGQGNTALSVSTGIEQLNPKIDMRPAPQDPSEFAARIYVKKNPLPKTTPGPTPVPTPAPAARP